MLKNVSIFVAHVNVCCVDMTAFAHNVMYNRKSVLAVIAYGEVLTTVDIMNRMKLDTDRKSVQRFSLFLRNSMEHSHLRRFKKREYGKTAEVSFWGKA